MGRRTTTDATDGEDHGVRCPVCYQDAVYWKLERQSGLECPACGYSTVFT